MKPIDRFNIHDALVSDELHQLVGVYSHLLSCVEKIIIETEDEDGNNIGVQVKNEINSRYVFYVFLRC